MTGGQTMMQKLTTVGVLVAVLVVALGLAVAPYVRLFGLFEETATTQDLVATLDRRVDMQTKLFQKRAGGASVRPEDAFIAGETIGIAGANLQSRLAELVSRNGGKVKTLLVVPPTQGVKPNLVSVNIVANMTLEGLQGALYEIETSVPLLFVDNIAISVAERSRDRKAAAGAVRVDVTMLVSGYRAASPQS